MAATREQLLATLAELRQELEEFGPLDSDAQLQLRGTLAEIQQALNRTSERPSSGSTIDEPPPTAGPESAAPAVQPAAPLTQRLSDAARELETTHPQLSMTLGGMIDALARMGI